MPNRALGLPLLAACFSLTLAAQNAPVLRPQNTEIGGFIGASYGIDKTRAMGGGNVAYAVSRVVMPYAEFSYFPGIGRKETVPISGGQTATFNFSIPISDFHGGVHLRVPIADSRIIPYGVFGAGLLRSSSRTERVTIATGGTTGNTTIPVTIPSETSFAVNGGGGIRYYVNERFGVRAEAKLYKPTGNFKDVFGKVEFGVFFQLH